jgi:hypothetical protein
MSYHWGDPNRPKGEGTKPSEDHSGLLNLIGKNLDNPKPLTQGELMDAMDKLKNYRPIPEPKLVEPNWYRFLEKCARNAKCDC